MFFQGNEKYNCATYLRLSRSDGDQQESNSIKNQRALLNDYMGKHPELHKFDEYVDDGYSGTNFERPDFKRMMQDIEKRNVNCIIVKDLSRFGRNYMFIAKQRLKFISASRMNCTVSQKNLWNIKHIMEMRWQRNEMGQLYKVDFQQDRRRKSIQYDCGAE